MAMMLADPELEAELLENRRAWGGDKYDEVWDGVYVMHAYPGDEHQDIVGGLQHAFYEAVQLAGLGAVRPGANIASDPANWKQDYRCPDVVVFMDQTRAKCHGAFWTTADFAVEVVSPGDQSRSKFDFYARVGTRELLLVDRDPWRLELYRHDGAEMSLAAQGDLSGEPISSDVLPIELRLVEGKKRPNLVVTHQATGKVWIV